MEVTALQIIVPHLNTDLDGLGAAIGAQVLYPHATIVLPGTPGPLAAEFISLHRYYVRTRTPREIDLASVTRAIVVDTADRTRLGALAAVAEHAEIHLYDHHPPEPDDLDATLEVRALVGSTCTLIAELIEEAGAGVSPVQATAMLLGIYADTGSLNHMGTTDRDARAAAFLLAHGANLRAVARFIRGSTTPAQQALLRQLQEHTRWLDVRGARIMLTHAETPEYVGGLSAVVHRLLQVQPAHSLFAVVRMGDRVHLIGRSEVPWVDADRAMEAFGGGGHAAAAAAVVKGASLQDVTARLEATLQQVVERPRLARDAMTSPVKTVLHSLPAREAERLMLRYGHSGMPVVDESGRLVGMVSLRDVEKVRRHNVEIPVKGMMVHHVVTVDPDMALDEVQDLLVEKDIGRVPVVEHGNLVGIITRSDLLGQVYGGPPPRWHRTLFTEAPGEEPESVVSEAVAAAPPGLQAVLRTVGEVAVAEGVRAYAVGGFVRDLLLRRPNFDLDIVVEGDGLDYARALGRALDGHVKEVPRFGTAHIFLKPSTSDSPTRLDVATARREFYEHAAALPLVEHGDLRQDLYRRDFSINAMAIPLGPDGPLGLVDFFGGLPDLQAGRVRILHTLSFVEDPTRILRAVRFAHRYGFSLEEETLACARQAVDQRLLDRVSIERLRNELILILREPNSGGAMAALQEMGALPRLLPGVTVDEGLTVLVDEVDRLMLRLPDLAEQALGWPVKLMALLHRLPLHAGLKAVTRLKLRRDEIGALVHGLTWWRVTVDLLIGGRAPRGEQVAALAEWSPDGLLFLCLLGCTDSVADYWRQWRHVKLEINGADLIAAGVPAGPQVGMALQRVLSDRLDGQAPDRASQLALALRYANEEE